MSDNDFDLRDLGFKGKKLAVAIAMTKSVTFFARLFWPLGKEDSLFFRPFAEFHEDILDQLMHYKKPITQVLVPRGYGKTKIVLLFILWSIVVNKRAYVVITSNGQRKAKQNLRDLKRMIEDEDFSEFFEIEQGNEWNQDVATFSYITGGTKHEVRIESRGLKQQTFGLCEGEHRPDLILLDDISSLEIVRNKDLLDNLETQIRQDIYPGLSTSDKMGRPGMIINIATPHDPDDIVYRLQKWKICNTIIYPIISPEGKPLYEALHNREDLAALEATYIESGNVSGWYAEMMMDPLKDIALRFNEDSLSEVSKNTANTLVRKRKATIRIIVDMAYTERTWSDFCGISVVAYFKDSQSIVLQSIKGKYSPEKFFEKLKDLSILYHKELDCIYCESKMLEFIRYFLHQWSIENKWPMDILPIADRGRSKHSRIGMLVPYVNRGYMQFVENENSALKKEMFSWSGGGTKKGYDVLDSLAYHVMFLIPTEVEETQSKHLHPSRDNTVAEMIEMDEIAEKEERCNFNVYDDIYGGD